MRLLRETPPLVGTLGRSEVEYAAALILYGLHRLGRAWTAPLDEAELLSVLQADLALGRGPVASWTRNPFMPVPDFDSLVAKGFATRDGGDVVAISLTPAALLRVAAHLMTDDCRDDDPGEYW